MLSFAVMSVLLLLFCFNSINENTEKATLVYLLGSIFSGTVYLIVCKTVNQKFVLPQAYLMMSGCYFFLIYLSVVISPGHRASAIIGVFCLMPTLFIDKPLRIFVFTAASVLIHSILSYNIKGPLLGSDDIINCIAFSIGGFMFGTIMNKTRIEAFTLENIIERQRDIDVLTNLLNRRKMFELFSQIELKTAEYPSCAIMIDVDDFKKYNDTYGHKQGDEFLKCFGQAMLHIEKQYNIKFYRYGGEEIAAFAWGYDYDEQMEMAEIIRLTVENLPIEYGRTVSIGLVFCEENTNANLETVLSIADKALYLAKNQGKNKVVGIVNSNV